MAEVLLAQLEQHDRMCSPGCPSAGGFEEIELHEAGPLPGVELTRREIDLGAHSVTIDVGKVARYVISGGRTVEVVKKILNEENIKVVSSETGGFFTCCLNLNMTSGQVDIEPAGQSKLTTDTGKPSASEIL